MKGQALFSVKNNKKKFRMPSALISLDALRVKSDRFQCHRVSRFHLTTPANYRIIKMEWLLPDLGLTRKFDRHMSPLTRVFMS